MKTNMRRLQIIIILLSYTLSFAIVCWQNKSEFFFKFYFKEGHSVKVKN